jgi:CxxC motif-containing protein (DUF1111 family)
MPQGRRPRTGTRRRWPGPIGLEVHLEAPSGQTASEVSGDPTYGRVNTFAVGGIQSEGVVTVQYREIEGYYYPDGTRWHMRAPHYRLTGLSHGPPAPTTVIKPRVAPGLYGVAQLEAVREAQIGVVSRQTRDGIAGTPAWHQRQGLPALGRFGWQADAISIRDQTTKALALEMELTSAERPREDCTPAEADCVQQANGAGRSTEEAVLWHAGEAAPSRRAFLDLGPRSRAALLQAHGPCARPGAQKSKFSLTRSQPGRPFSSIARSRSRCCGHERRAHGSTVCAQPGVAGSRHPCCSLGT